MVNWPKNITLWQVDRTGYMSVPFTWLLLKAQRIINQGDFFVDEWVVGGPAVELMPDFIEGATIGKSMPGVLQRVNSLATRTTRGCPRRCPFCGVGQRRIKGEWREYNVWPDGPIICDDNLMAASDNHFGRVMAQLQKWPWCDFNQGLDARYMTMQRASLLAGLNRPRLRFALDSDTDRDSWANAVDLLLTLGVAKSRIRTYVLCGWKGSPENDWQRCEFVESFKIKALPMWYHPLDAMEHNAVTVEQAERGWTREGQRQLMGWYYQHRGRKLTC